jgi:hypothetical protein
MGSRSSAGGCLKMATSSAELALPDELGGSWEHALILSYGLDLPFFERALARELAPTCINRILLGDERTYLAGCDAYAAGGLVRSANRAYVAEPILRRTSSHAKVILLTSTRAGQLFVGSGNLSRQGYASGGELFTRYVYGEGEFNVPPEFVAVRTLLERLRDDDLLTQAAVWHVERLLEGTPWLYGAPDKTESRVRHNLDRSLADQFEEALNGERVEELVVLAPFFDPELAALRDLIARLRPGLTTVMVQRAQTSIDPDVLERLRHKAESALEVRPVERPPQRPWVHAKLILARTSDAAVCLQGSANMSVAALLRTGMNANLEVVNLLRGERAAFDSVLDELDVGAVAGDLADMELRFNPGDEKDRLADEGWQLTAGEWSDGVLDVRYRGELPPLDGAAIESGRMTFLMDIVEARPGSLRLSLTTPQGEHARDVTPVWLALADGRRSNAIFPADRGALARALELGTDPGEKLARIGDLGLADDELEQLLQELEGTLVIDRRSLWQLSGRPTQPADDGAEEPHIGYADIDYEMLRSHPRMQQYLRGIGSHGGPQSRLQIVLHAITSAFAEIAAADSVTAIVDQAVGAHPEPEDGGAEEEDDEERPRRRWAIEARLNVLFRNFIGRFLRGLASREFQDIAGPEVLARNYVIFFHLLSLLVEREWIDQRLVIEAVGQTIELFWGTTDATGYAGRLDKHQRAEMLKLVRETHNDARLIATLYSASRDTRLANLADLRVGLRAAWRGILVQGAPSLTTAALADARLMLRGVAPPDGPTFATIFEELYDLAEFLTRGELVAALAARIGVRETACVFIAGNVHSPWLGTINVETLQVEDDDARLDLADAQSVLGAWIAVERRRHYRLAVSSRDGRTRFVAFYEPGAQQGRYAALADESPAVSLTFLRPPAALWDDAIGVLMEATDAAASGESQAVTA